MEQLHRDLTRWEDNEKLKETRAPYAGQDELDGKYYDQVYPINDIMCVNCCKKHKDKDFVKKAQMVEQTGFCHFCGTYYNFLSLFCQVSLYVGKDSLKRYSRLSQYGNNKEDWEKSTRKIEQKTHDIARRFE